MSYGTQSSPMQYHQHTSLVRDLKLGMATGDYDVKLNTSNLFPLFPFGRKKFLKSILNNGAVLIGSRALLCYKINGHSIMNRKPNDWDFVMSESNFLDFCKDHKIYDFDLSKSSYQMNKSLATFIGSYSESHWFPCPIQIVIREEEEPYNEKDGIKFSKLDSIIENKIKLSNDHKHFVDINNIMVNLHAIK